MKTKNRLSHVYADSMVVSGDRLSVDSRGIEVVDRLVGKRVGDVEYVKIDNNKIDSTVGLDQFVNMKWLDISNNNISTLSDIRLLSRNKRLEYLDLRNNPIAYHTYYKEFIIIYVDNIKYIDTERVSVDVYNDIRNNSMHIKHILNTIVVRYLKILCIRHMINKINIKREMKIRDDIPVNDKIYDMIERNMIEYYNDDILIEIEAYILDDIEILMDKYFNSTSFDEAWGTACKEYGMIQISKYEEYISILHTLCNGSISKHTPINNTTQIPIRDNKKINKKTPKNNTHDNDMYIDRSVRGVDAAKESKSGRTNRSVKGADEVKERGGDRRDAVYDNSIHTRNCTLYDTYDNNNDRHNRLVDIYNSKMMSIDVLNKEYDNILYNIHTSNISYNNIHVYDVYTDDIRSDIDAYRPHVDKYYHTLASIKDTSSQLSRVDHHISSISSSIARYIQKISHKDIIDLSNPDTHDNTYVDHTEEYRRGDNEDVVKVEGGEEEDTHGQRGEVQKGRLDIYDFDEYDEYSVAEVPPPRTDSVKVSSSYRNSLMRKVYNRWRDHTANITQENEEKRRMVLSKLYSNMRNSKDIQNKIHESHTSRLVSSCFSLWMDRWRRYREVHGRISRMYDRNISTRCLTVIRDVCNSSASGRVYAQRHRLHVLRTSYKHMIEYRDMKRAQKTLMESVMRIRYDKYRRQLLSSFKRNTRIVHELKCMSGRYRNRVLNDAYRCIADNAREEISYRSSILKMTTVLDSLLHRNVSSSFHSISLIYYTHNRHAHVYISSYR